MKQHFIDIVKLMESPSTRMVNRHYLKICLVVLKIKQ